MRESIKEPARELPVTDTCDVLVAGGGIAGVSAALAAARNGADVLLLEREFGLGGLAFHVLIAVGSTAAFAAIFTFLGMLLSRRTATVIVVLTWFALLLGASSVENILSEPEFTSGIVMTVDGMQTISMEPNPRYVSGALRTFYEFLRDLIPAGQAIQVQNLEVFSPLRALLCDLGVTAVFTLGGLALFERKDLK